jgi:hypothetical protein
MRRLVMRPDLIAMGTAAAIVGLALAVLLTASFGARSSGPPAALKAGVATPSAPAAKAAAQRQEAAVAVLHRRAERKKRDRRRRQARARRQASAPPVSPVVAESQPLTTTQSRPTIQPQTQQTRPVASPAPRPQRVQPLSKPKPGGSGGGKAGGAFDDSG